MLLTVELRGRVRDHPRHLMLLDTPATRVRQESTAEFREDASPLTPERTPSQVQSQTSSMAPGAHAPKSADPDSGCSPLQRCSCCETSSPPAHPRSPKLQYHISAAGSLAFSSARGAKQ